MLLPGCHIPRTLIFITVFVTAIIAYPYPEDDKTFNLKIGFDLTHGENGAPALRIRDFEDSKEFSPRAKDDKQSGETSNSDKKRDEDDNKGDVSDESTKEQTGFRAGSKTSSSESDSGEKKSKKDSSSREAKPNKAPGAKESDKSDEDENSGDSDVDAKRSTRGLLAEDVEPEDKNPKVHERGDSDRRRKRSAEPRRRNKRAAEKFIQYRYENMKRKHKKVRRMPLRARSTSYKPY